MAKSQKKLHDKKIVLELKMDDEVPVASFIDVSKKDKTNFVDMLIFWDCMTTVMIDSISKLRGDDMGMRKKLVKARELVMEGLGISTQD